MCTDVCNLWYATLQVNTNHAGKFTTLLHVSHTNPLPGDLMLTSINQDVHRWR